MVLFKALHYQVVTFVQLQLDAGHCQAWTESRVRALRLALSTL
jgi:hypothetical protein